MRERVLQIRLALLGDGRRLVPLSEYLELWKTVPAVRPFSPTDPNHNQPLMNTGIVDCHGSTRLEQSYPGGKFFAAKTRHAGFISLPSACVE